MIYRIKSIPVFLLTKDFKHFPLRCKVFLFRKTGVMSHRSSMVTYFMPPHVNCPMAYDERCPFLNCPGCP